MLNDLKFVQGAVAKKDFVPELTHFHIGDGRIYGFNGVLAISTPTDLAVTATPKARSFVKAVEKLPEDAEVVLNLTAAGRLSVKAGNFRVFVECHETSKEFVKVSPGGELVELPAGILPVLRKLAPFMGIDASRPWAMGIRLDGQSAYATNNIVLVQHWLPMVFPTPLTIPAEAVKEMLRIKADPTHIQLEANAVSFHYPNGAWLRTQLAVGDWPDISRILDVECAPLPLPEGFFDAINRLDGFTNDANDLHLRGDIVATSPHDDDGAQVTLPGFDGIGCHFLNQVARLDGVATQIDFSLYPSPCIFYGDMLRGAIVGKRA